MQHHAYELRNYDETLMHLEARRDDYGREYLVAAEIEPGVERLLPMPVLRALSQAPTAGPGTASETGASSSLDSPPTTDETPSPAKAPHDAILDATWSWMRSRVVPRNRTFVSSLLAQAGLVAGDTLGIINLCKGLSVNDAYWIVPEGFDGRYADFNLFDNELDEVLSLVAYTGYTSSQHRRLGLSSEWTTDGQAAKAWRRIDGQLLLYKAGTEGYANAGTEPYSELFCSQVAERAGLAHVPYRLDRWQGKLASVCPLMHGPDVAFVPWHAATGATTVAASLRAAHELGPATLDAIRAMYVFDALVHNPDRHTNNFGVLRDCHSGEILGPAPLFDHNLALFAGDMASDFAGWPERGGKDRPSGTGMTLDGLARLVMSEKARAALQRLANAGTPLLTDDDRHPIGAARVAALNAYLRERCCQLLELPIREEADLFTTLDELESTALTRAR